MSSTSRRLSIQEFIELVISAISPGSVTPMDVRSAAEAADVAAGVVGPRIVAAAQDELCPDTLN
jgi:hypothetical protein